MNHLVSTSLKELENLYKKEKDPYVKLRLLVVIHRKEGKDYRTIATILRIAIGKAFFWVKRFSKHGMKGLQRKPGSGGQNRYLIKEQEKELREKLKEHPMTTKEVLVYIKERYGKRYHPNSIPRLLKRLGQSLITPRPRHYKVNPRSGWAFKGHIKKACTVES